jgi:hypothetical protein
MPLDSDRPDPMEPESIDRQAPGPSQDLHAVVFPVAAGVFIERYVVHPVRAVLDRPALADGP